MWGSGYYSWGDDGDGEDVEGEDVDGEDVDGDEGCGSIYFLFIVVVGEDCFLVMFLE